MRSHPMLIFGTLALAGPATLVVGCCPQWAPEIPFSQTPYGRGISSRGISRACGRQILAELTSRQRRKLRQLWFMANLHHASGSEESPWRLYRRTQRELEHPVALSIHAASRVLSDMARVRLSMASSVRPNRARCWP